MRVTIAAALVAAIAAGASGQSHVSDQVTAYTRPLSPSVLGTFVIRERQVELLVLWRDTPGWFLRGDERRATYSGHPGTFTASLEYGGVRLELAHDREHQTATVAGMPASLTDGRNVILVDNVAGTLPQRTVTTVAADLRGHSENPAVAEILGRSGEVRIFLRCDTDSSRRSALPAPANDVCEDLERK